MVFKDHLQKGRRHLNRGTFALSTENVVKFQRDKGFRPF
jgi:hypothetical protein